MKLFSAFFLKIALTCVFLQVNCKDIQHEVHKEEVSNGTASTPENTTLNSILPNILPSPNTNFSTNETSVYLPQDLNGSSNLSLIASNVSSQSVNASLVLVPATLNTSSTSDTNDVQAQNGVRAPNYFPNGTSLNGTKIYDGDEKKLLSLVQKQNFVKLNNTNVTTIGMEVTDLLNVTQKEKASSNKQPLVPSKPIKVSDKINDDTELIEDGENTEDELRMHVKKEAEDINPGFPEGQFAAILVCTLTAISVISYAALLAWRRYLENKYGSRQMLVNEEDFDDPNDMRHFSI